jgi:hypothetical protein
MPVEAAVATEWDADFKKLPVGSFFILYAFASIKNLIGIKAEYWSGG